MPISDSVSVRYGRRVVQSYGVLAERAWFIAGTVPERSQRHLRNHVVLVIAATVLVGWAGMWWRDNVWQQRTAALLAATNMSTLRTVIRDTDSSSAR